MAEKLTSRKLWVALGGVMSAVGAALAGQVEWGQAIQDVVYLVIAYLGVQGTADVVTAAKAGKPPTNPLMGIVGLALIAGLLGGCSTFVVSDPVTGNVVVQTWGAPFLTRQDSFTVTREWLDSETNTLQSMKIDRNTDENADAQVEALRLVADYAKAVGAATAGATGAPATVAP